MMPDNAAGHAAAASPLGVALRLLKADAPTQVTEPRDWPRWAVLLPHVLAATGHLDSAAGQPDAQTMADGSRLLGLAGYYLWVHARHADAKALEERALAIDEAAYGPGHPAVATDLNNLAQILQDLGQPEAARPLQERALAITQAAQAAGSGRPGAEAGQ